MHQITLFQDKKSKIIWGGAQPPPQTPPPVGTGTPPPHTPPLGAYDASMLAPSAPRLKLKDDFVF